MAQLEETLQGGKPFVYPFAVLSRCRFCSRATDWTQIDPNEKQAGNDVLMSLLDDPMVARLYWAMARMDTETARPCGNLREYPGCFHSLRCLIFTAVTSPSGTDA